MLSQHAVSILSQHICDGTAAFEMGQDTETSSVILLGLIRQKSSDSGNSFNAPVQTGGSFGS